jgi:hypothetical protein
MRYAISLLLLAPFCLAQDKGKAAPEHPYAKAKVGDWVSHKTTMSGSPQTFTSKQTVTARTDDTVTVSMENKFGDMATPAQEQKINLKDKFDPLDPPAVNGVKPVVKKLGEGKEKITVGGKTYDCTWLQYEYTMTIDGKKFKSVVKTWTCKDVPLGGMVKNEADADGNKSVMELTGHGSKK